MPPNNQQRRDAARRQLERKLADRQVRQAANRQRTLVLSIAGTIALVVAVVLVIVLAGGSSKKHNPSAGQTASVSPSVAASPTGAAADLPCNYTSDPSTTVARKVDEPVTMTPPTTGTVQVTVKTTQGNMTFKLNWAEAPCTVESFVSLVQQNYYNDSPCHRVVTSGIFVLQCGDPTGTGEGGPGYTIPDEANGNETYPAGTIAMARTSQAHSGGSQFFIVYKNSPDLMQNLGNLQYTVFGKVTAGLNVVTKVAAAGAETGTDGEPKLPIKVTTMSITG